MKTKLNFLERMFNRQTGELVVITERTPEGRYEHVIRQGGDLESRRAVVEEMKRKNVERYETDMSELDDNSLFVESVTSYTRNFIHGSQSGIFTKTENIEYNKLLASKSRPTGTW